MISINPYKIFINYLVFQLIYFAQYLFKLIGKF